ncbi:MAG: hypothetical protein O9284_06440 [Steroidobacteraceae bacterium]|nr:hypothetical protein [Steroidobacteraceae bacterium]
MRFRQFVAAVVLVGQAFAAWAGTPARTHCDEATAAPAAPAVEAGSAAVDHPCGMSEHAAPMSPDVSMSGETAVATDSPVLHDAPVAPATPDGGPATISGGCAFDCCCIAFALPLGAADVGSPPSAVSDARGAHRVPAAVLARDLRPPIA